MLKYVPLLLALQAVCSASIRGACQKSSANNSTAVEACTSCMDPAVTAVSCPKTAVPNSHLPSQYLETRRCRR